MKKIVLSLAVSLAVVTTANAGSLVDVGAGMQGRVNHEMLYADDCEACHTGSPKQYVDDSACIDCHGDINEIEIDEEQLTMAEANPHTSVHYNQGASCLACHGEHETKKPVCAECHRTWFDEQ